MSECGRVFVTAMEEWQKDMLNLNVPIPEEVELVAAKIWKSMVEEWGSRLEWNECV
jgi:hypothetical protein